jgi:hypothetical protein
MLTLSISTSTPYRDLIAANNFELQDKKRTKGKNPVLHVVVSALNAQTFTSAEESSDSFELQMLKPSSNLKNTNGRVCEHYKLQNLKILEVCPALSLRVCLSTCTYKPTIVSHLPSHHRSPPFYLLPLLLSVLLLRWHKAPGHPVNGVL